MEDDKREDDDNKGREAGDESADSASDEGRKPKVQTRAGRRDAASVVDEDDDEDDEGQDEDDEEEPSPPPKQAKKGHSGGDKKSVAAGKEEAPLVPADPAAVRSGELRVGLMTATAGYLAFWGAWMIYSKSIAARHVNYFSHSAWLFMIAYSLVTVACFYFVRLDVSARYPSSAKGDQASSPASAPAVDRNGVLLAAAVCGPLYAIYWYVARSVLRAHYSQNWWILELVAFLAVSIGAWWGLRPPSLEDERRERMPTRRVLTLMMVPFLMVFGMIWLASVYPPWPS